MAELIGVITDIDLNPMEAVVRFADGRTERFAYDQEHGSDYRSWYEELVPDAEAVRSDSDFPTERDGRRWRACVYKHAGGVTVTLRAHPLEMPVLGELGLGRESELLSLCRGSGLTVFVGPTGSGKSATMTACIRALLKSGELGKAITIEAPIEVLHDDPMIHQRQVGVHVTSMAAGIISAMRQYPQTLVIGEIRSPDAAKEVIDVAFSGHRVLATLHADSVKGAIERLWRLLDDQHDEMLPAALQGVVAQHLVRFPGAAIPVWESLAVDEECRAVLSQGMAGITQLGYHQKRQGRFRLQDCALRLARERQIPREHLSRWI